MTRADLAAGDRTAFGRHAERGSHDREGLYEVLDAGLVCHLGLVIDGAPLVLPTGYGRRDDVLYLHGSVAARYLRHAADGAEVCVTVTHVDGLVLAGAAFDHSMNYRSAVVFGRARLIDAPEDKLTGLRAITEHLAPGQWDRVRSPDRKELAATMVLALPLASASVKVRTGPPSPPDKPGEPPWTGVLPVHQSWGEPVAAPHVPAGTTVPPNVAGLAGAPVGDRHGR